MAACLTQQRAATAMLHSTPVRRLSLGLICVMAAGCGGAAGSGPTNPGESNDSGALRLQEVATTRGLVGVEALEKAGANTGIAAMGS